MLFKGKACLWFELQVWQSECYPWEFHQQNSFKFLFVCVWGWGVKGAWVYIRIGHRIDIICVLGLLSLSDLMSRRKQPLKPRTHRPNGGRQRLVKKKNSWHLARVYVSLSNRNRFRSSLSWILCLNYNTNSQRYHVTFTISVGNFSPSTLFPFLSFIHFFLLYYYSLFCSWSSQ